MPRLEFKPSDSRAYPLECCKLNISVAWLLWICWTFPGKDSTAWVKCEEQGKSMNDSNYLPRTVIPQQYTGCSALEPWWNGNYKKISEKGQYCAFPGEYWYGYEISELSALIIKLWYLIEKLAFAKRPGPPLSHSSFKVLLAETGLKGQDLDSPWDPVSCRFSSTYNTGRAKAQDSWRLLESLGVGEGEQVRCAKCALAAGKTWQEGKCHCSGSRWIQRQVGGGRIPAKVNHVAFSWAYQKEGMFYFQQTAHVFYKLNKIIAASTLELSHTYVCVWYESIWENGVEGGVNFQD